MYKDGITVILYDGGYKDSAPALLSLANQTILSKMQIIWVEFYNRVFEKVYDYNFITKIKLNCPKQKPFHIGFCWNVALVFAEHKFLTIVDPCLWFPKKTFETIYNLHVKNPNFFSYHIEKRDMRKGNPDTKLATKLTKEYFKPETKKFKTLHGNWGCLPTMNTEKLVKLNGFDIYTSIKRRKGGLNDPLHHNTLNLTRLRLVNDGAEIYEHKRTAVHPWHPTSLEIDNPVARMKLKNQYKSDKTIKKAKLGLEYIKEVFDVSDVKNIKPTEKDSLSS